MRPDAHQIYARRRGRNLGLGLTLAGFAALIFAVTVVKLGEGQSMEGFDHTLRPSLLPAAEDRECVNLSKDDATMANAINGLRGQNRPICPKIHTL